MAANDTKRRPSSTIGEKSEQSQVAATDAARTLREQIEASRQRRAELKASSNRRTAAVERAQEALVSLRAKLGETPDAEGDEVAKELERALDGQQSRKK